jgi:hypothetical protein
VGIEGGIPVKMIALDGLLQVTIYQ